MCRLFGFRSIFTSQVHTSLVGANNALMNQSKFNPDGWGVAYYLEDTPHIIKSAQSAINDALFEKVSGIVSSKTVLAHIRKATKGENNILNCHPFQYGKWVFAHNGNIKDFQNLRGKIISEIDSRFQRYLLGDTDSEVFFYFLLTKLEKFIDGKIQTHLLMKEIMQKAMQDLIDLIGPYSAKVGDPDKETYLTFILTNGKDFVAFNGGQPLYYTTHKTKCPESETCEHYEFSCENKVANGRVNHLIISSEPLSNENVWFQTKPGNLLFMDELMKFSLHELNLANT